jgi:hypothetical protein
MIYPNIFVNIPMAKPYLYANAGILEGNWTEERTGLPPARE